MREYHIPTELRLGRLKYNNSSMLARFLQGVSYIESKHDCFKAPLLVSSRNRLRDCEYWY